MKGTEMSELEHEVGILRSENLKLRNEVALLSQQTQHNQPQLTISKSIADKLDKFIKTDFDEVGHEDWWIQENGLIEWFSKTPNCYIKDAYLAGKALGVDLVKVVEK